MTVEELGKQMTEYHMRVEEVLNGMDTVLTRFDTRLISLESRLMQMGKNIGESSDHIKRIERMEQQITILNTALKDLLDEMDHD